MNAHIDIQLNHSSQAAIFGHLLECNSLFIPTLSTRVDLEDYAAKLTQNTTRFEALHDGKLVGLVAAYLNDHNFCNAFLSNVSVIPQWHRLGIASRLLTWCIHTAQEAGFREVSLETDHSNTASIRLYTKEGFFLESAAGATITMRKLLQKER
jgi:ribosomal protein S18 acetylase RimI-like enzyme